MKLINNIQQVLAIYNAKFPQDRVTTEKLNQLIAQGINVSSRSEMLGHVTAGAILFNDDNQVLMLHHVVLDKWLFPGGHVEAEDTLIRESALRELVEESGIPESDIIPFGDWRDDMPIHIDCHPIPENPKKGEGDHQHFDFRFMFKVAKPTIVLQEEEVKGFKWVDVSHAPDVVKQRIEAIMNEVSTTI